MIDKYQYNKHIHDPIDGSKDIPIEPPYEGVWLPISIAAYIIDKNRQTISLMAVNNTIRSVQYPVGPLLVSMEDLYNDYITPKLEKEHAKTE